MLPRGNDRILPFALTEVRKKMMYRYFKNIWPGYVVEHMTDLGMAEYFVYKDVQSLEAWDKEGFSKATENTMFHILGDVEEMTIVYDPGCTKIVDELENMFRANSCFG